MLRMPPETVQQLDAVAGVAQPGQKSRRRHIGCDEPDIGMTNMARTETIAVVLAVLMGGVPFPWRDPSLEVSAALRADEHPPLSRCLQCARSGT